MSVARHTTYNVVGTVVPIAVSLVTVPLYLEAIGLDRYGVLSICWVLLGYFGFFDLGLGRATAQRIAASAEADPEERSHIFWTSLWTNIALGVVGALILLPVAEYALSAMQDVPLNIQGEIGAAVPWLAASVPVATLTGVLSGALQGRERFLAINVVSASSTSVMSVAPLVTAYIVGPRLDLLLATSLIVRLLSLGLLFVICVRAVPLKKDWKPHRRLIKYLLVFGGWVTVANMAAPLLFTFDRFAVGVLISAAAVSVYVVPFTLVSRLSLVPQSLSTALFPRFAAGEENNSERLQTDSVSALIAVMTPLCLLAMVAIDPFMRLWVGKSLATQSVPIAQVLIVGFWIHSFARIPSVRIQASGRPDLIAKVVFAELIPYGVLLYALLSGLGIIGAALAWTVRGIWDTGIFFVLTKQGRSALRSLAPPFLIVLATMGVAMWLPLNRLGPWLILAALFLASLYQSFRVMPPSMKAHSRSMTSRLYILSRSHG